MKLNTRTVVELLGGLAVVVSLIFVGLQIRQANTIAGREARAEMDFQAFELNRIVFDDPSSAALKVKLRLREPELNSEEAELALGLAAMHTYYWAALNGVIESGLVPDEMFEIYADEVRITFRSYPGLCPFLSSLQYPSVRNADFKFFNIILEEIDRIECESWEF